MIVDCQHGSFHDRCLTCTPYTATVDFVFDGPPGPEAGRFVEVEVEGKSIRLGEWSQRVDGYWVLRVPGVDLTASLSGGLTRG
jgi:hypothetical protein